MVLGGEPQLGKLGPSGLSSNQRSSDITAANIHERLATLKDHYEFQSSLNCLTYVEKPYYATNNGFRDQFQERPVDICPGCLGPAGEKQPNDLHKNWSVRVCDTCKDVNPGGGDEFYSGQAVIRTKRAAAANPTDNEQPNSSTSQPHPLVCNHL